MYLYITPSGFKFVVTFHFYNHVNPTGLIYMNLLTTFSIYSNLKLFKPQTPNSSNSSNLKPQTSNLKLFKPQTLQTSYSSNFKLFKPGTQNELKHFRHHATDTATSHPFDGWDGYNNQLIIR